MSDLLETLASWNAVTTELEAAIANRENRQFILLYRKGCRCFDTLKSFIDNNDKESLLRFQAEIHSTINKWHHITELLKPWMSEVQTKLNTSKAKKQKQQKVGKLFKTSSNKAGMNLRIKAK